MKRVCLCLPLKNLDYCKAVVKVYKLYYVELRLDLSELTNSELEELILLCKEFDIQLIATFHLNLKVATDEDIIKAHLQLRKALELGCDIVDIDINTPEKSRTLLANFAKERGCKVIFSYHNFEFCDSDEVLKFYVQRGIDLGGDYIKIATVAHSNNEKNRVMRLYKEFTPSKLLVFCMGEKWRRTRFTAVKKGSPFQYIALNPLTNCAPGQNTLFDFERVSFPDFGCIKFPESKSIFQRSVIAAALSSGTSYFHYTNGEYQELCDDSLMSLAIAKSYGACINNYENKIFCIDATGITPGEKISSRRRVINVGESGLLARISLILTSFISSNYTIRGKGTLLKRDLSAVAREVEQMGLKIELTDGKFLPANVNGKIVGGNYSVSGKESSQLISALLFALPLCTEGSVLAVQDVKSFPYIALTCDILKKFDIKINILHCDLNNGSIIFQIPGNQSYKSTTLNVEADWSSVALTLVAGTIIGQTISFGVTPKSIQADSDILEVLKRCHASVVIEEVPGQNLAVICASRGVMLPFEYDISSCPDLFPALFLLALRCSGVSVIKGIDRLNNKESNRAETFMEEFSKLGNVFFYQQDNNLFIEGGYLKTLQGGVEVDSHNDHRLAMALMIASYMCDETVVITNYDCVNKSFPAFFKYFGNIRYE